MKRKKISRFNSFVMVMLIISFLFGFCGVGQLFGEKNEIPQTEEVSTPINNPANVIPEKEPVIDSGNYTVKTWDEKLEEMFDNGEGFQIPLVDGRYQISTAKELAMVSYLSNHNGVYPYPLENTKGYVEGAPIYTVTTEDSQEEYMQLDYIDATFHQDSFYIPANECARISGHLTQFAVSGYSGIITVSGGFSVLYSYSRLAYQSKTGSETIMVNNWYTGNLNNQKIFFDINENEGLFTWGDYSGTLPTIEEKTETSNVRLFNTRWDVGNKMYFHDLQFYGFDNVMTHNLIPAIRLSDKRCGLFDTIGKKFYTASAQQNRASLTVSGKTFELTNDVYLNDGKLGLTETTDESGKTTYSVAYEDGGDNYLYKWEPITQIINLYGKGHEIHGMFINNNKDNSAFVKSVLTYYRTYFDNVHFKNSMVFNPKNTASAGFVGSLSSGEINNCSYDGFVVCLNGAAGIAIDTDLGGGYTGGSVKNSINYGRIIAIDSSAGGITAAPIRYDKTIGVSGCVNYGHISSNSGNTGGIAGGGYRPGDKLSDCINYGKVTNKSGKAYGVTYCGATNSVNYGEVYSENSYAHGIGERSVVNSINYGFVSSKSSNAFGISYNKAEGCINYATISAQGDATGITAQGDAKNSTNHGNITSENANAYGIGGSTLQNCSNYGNVTSKKSNAYGTGGGTVRDCRNYGDIVAKNHAMGIATATSFLNCYNYGAIKGNYAGGLASSISQNTNIYNCGNYAEVTSETANAGGLVGAIAGCTVNIKQCENVGKVTAKITSTTTYAGGLVGSITSGSTTIESCTNEGKVSGKTATGFVGQATSSCTIKNSLNNGDITSSTYKETTLSSTFGVNNASQLTNCITSSKINGEKVNACAYVKDGYFSEQYRTGKIISSNASHTAQFQGVIDADYIKENSFVDFTPPPEDSNKMYTKLEYIQSGGNQYIDTGYVANQNTKVEITLMDSSSDVYENYFGGSKYRFLRNDRNAKVFLINPEIVRREVTLDLTNKKTLTFSSSGITDEKNNVYASSLSLVADTKNMLIFGSYYNNNFDIYGNFMLYSFKISEGETTIRDFIPAKRNSDGAVGLYETKECKFYTDANGGNFIAGPKASSVPDGYTELESIKSNGYKYIDTGVVMGDHIEVQAGFKYNSKQNTSGIYDTALFGVGVSGKLSNFCAFYTAEGFFRMSSNGYAVSKTIDLEYHDVVFNRKTDRGILIDGDLYGNINTNLTNSRNLYLFRNNQSNLVTGAQANIYYVRLYDNGTLIRNFIPAKRNSDKILGLYDTVEKKFYTDAKGGNFEVGDPV